MKKSIKNRIPGVLIVVLLAIALVLFMAILIKIKLLPTKFLLLAGGIFLIYAICVFLLTRNSERVGAMICGCMMTMLMLIALMLGTPYLTRAVDTLGNITGVDVEIADVGVYVRSDSVMTQLEDLTGGSIGMMEQLDRENSEKALAELIDGLMDSEVNAILVNSAYLDLLADMDGYEEVNKQIRQIHTYKAETVIEKPKDKTGQTDDWGISGVFGENKENKDRVFTMYISGIDSRSGLIAKSRSDVNIIATVNVDTRRCSTVRKSIITSGSTSAVLRRLSMLWAVSPCTLIIPLLPAATTTTRERIPSMVPRH